MMEIDLFLDMSQDNLLFSLSVSVAWKSKIEEAGGANLLPEVTKPLEQTSTTHLPTTFYRANQCTISKPIVCKSSGENQKS